jgi:hypothetical protein
MYISTLERPKVVRFVASENRLDEFSKMSSWASKASQGGEI